MKKASTYTEQVMKLEVTFIGDCAKTAEEIKKALGADHVLIKSTKAFEHEPTKKSKGHTTYSWSKY